MALQEAVRTPIPRPLATPSPQQAPASPLMFPKEVEDSDDDDDEDDEKQDNHARSKRISHRLSSPARLQFSSASSDIPSLPTSPLKRKRIQSDPMAFNSSSSSLAATLMATSQIPALSLDVRNLRQCEGFDDVGAGGFGAASTGAAVRMVDESGCPDSPRSRVAERLRCLEIQQRQQLLQGGIDEGEDDSGDRKRVKWAVEEGKGESGCNKKAVDLQEDAFKDVEMPPADHLIPNEIHNRPHPSSPISSSANVTQGKKRRLSSPPPLSAVYVNNSPQSHTRHHQQHLTNHFPISQSPHSNSYSSISDSASDDTDDGEGVNGIGFKPTPAVAYARSEKRRRQVNEWKAREAREERQRRIERRRGANGGSGGFGERRRVVRFEEGVG